MKGLVINTIFNDVKLLIEQTKSQVAINVNSALTMLYWQIGKYINDDVLKNSRAKYGKEIVQALSAQLTKEYGKGYSKQNLLHMCRFNEVFPDFQIVSTLWRQLAWSSFKTIKNET